MKSSRCQSCLGSRFDNGSISRILESIGQADGRSLAWPTACGNGLKGRHLYQQQPNDVLLKVPLTQSTINIPKMLSQNKSTRTERDKEQFFLMVYNTKFKDQLIEATGINKQQCKKKVPLNVSRDISNVYLKYTAPCASETTKRRQAKNTKEIRDPFHNHVLKSDLYQSDNPKIKARFSVLSTSKHYKVPVKQQTINKIPIASKSKLSEAISKMLDMISVRKAKQEHKKSHQRSALQSRWRHEKIGKLIENVDRVEKGYKSNRSKDRVKTFQITHRSENESLESFETEWKNTYEEARKKSETGSKRPKSKERGVTLNKPLKSEEERKKTDDKSKKESGKGSKRPNSKERGVTSNKSHKSEEDSIEYFKSKEKIKHAKKKLNTLMEPHKSEEDSTEFFKSKEKIKHSKKTLKTRMEPHKTTEESLKLKYKIMNAKKKSKTRMESHNTEEESLKLKDTIMKAKKKPITRIEPHQTEEESFKLKDKTINAKKRKKSKTRMEPHKSEEDSIEFFKSKEKIKNAKKNSKTRIEPHKSGKDLVDFLKSKKVTKNVNTKSKTRIKPHKIEAGSKHSFLTKQKPKHVKIKLRNMKSHTSTISDKSELFMSDLAKRKLKYKKELTRKNITEESLYAPDEINPEEEDVYESTIELTNAQNGETNSLAPSEATELKKDPFTQLVVRKSRLDSFVLDDRIEDSKKEQVLLEGRRSRLALNERIRESIHKERRTSISSSNFDSHEYRLSQVRKFLFSSELDLTYMETICIDDIDFSTFLHYPYEMESTNDEEDTKTIKKQSKLKRPTKSKIKQRIESEIQSQKQETEADIESSKTQKKCECCICNELNRHRSVGRDPLLMKMKQELKRIELKAYIKNMQIFKTDTDKLCESECSSIFKTKFLVPSEKLPNLCYTIPSSML